MVLYCRQWVWDTFRKKVPVVDVPVLAFVLTFCHLAPLGELSLNLRCPPNCGNSNLNSMDVMSYSEDNHRLKIHVVKNKGNSISAVDNNKADLLTAILPNMAL
jgi:hypothetical protein